MKKIISHITLVFIGLTFVVGAQAEVSLAGVRIGAQDVAATGEFYKNTFDLEEVLYFTTKRGKKAMYLGFKGNENKSVRDMGTAVVIFGRDSDSAAEDIPHLIFEVKDLDAVYAKALKNGAIKVDGPTDNVNVGLRLVFFKDTANNVVELMQKI